MSIVIPVFNKFNFTKSCLKDLSHLPNDHEIIIVDNGSTDKTRESLEGSTEIKYVRFEQNKGFAVGCNYGAFKSEGKNILFLNNDIRVKSDHSTWTQKLIEKCDNALVGPTMGQLDNSLNFVQEANKVLPGKSYMSGWCIAASRRTWQCVDFLRPVENNDDDFDEVRRIPQIFSEEFGIAYFEDTDLSFRARDLGIKFEVVDIPVVHFGKQTSRQLNTYQLYKNARKIFVEKWSRK